MQILQSTTEQPTMASMNEVVMKKSELIDHLVANKAKHDVILAAAIAGYWETAQTRTEKRKAKFDAQLEEYRADVEREFQKVFSKIASKEELPSHISIRAINVDASLGLVYPEDHSQDYERAIRMMQASVFDQVRLTPQEFDAYVLNNWEWKKQFIASNTFYVNTVSNKLGAMALTGCSKGIAGSYAGYEVAARAAVNDIAVSGMTVF